jgi:hypothetical protein
VQWKPKVLRLDGNRAVELGGTVGLIGFALGMLIFAYIKLPAIWKA